MSEKPIDLILLNSVKFFGNPIFFKFISQSTISLIWPRNHGSILDNLKILFKLIFFLTPSATSKILFGIFSLSFFSICRFDKLNILSRPEKPVSNDIKAF